MIPNIREVVDSLLGKSNLLFPNNKKAIGTQWFGLRQADYTKRCGCTPEEGTSEGSNCSRCFSTGYLFTDYLVKGYMWMGVLGTEFNSIPGVISTQQKNLVIQHDRIVNKFDFVLELDHDPATSKPRQPFQIVKIYRVQDSLPIRGDDSRVEFWKCSIEERNIEDGRPNDLGTGYKYKGNRSNVEPQ
ncbi:MAG: hypothetical protein KDH96_07415 [Candidatus Riesia sp.]|nr:hypothetical protein [Candidatus Riesia sp.]